MKNRNKVYDSLILIMQFGINMIVPIFLCVGLGVFRVIGQNVLMKTAFKP